MPISINEHENWLNEYAKKMIAQTEDPGPLRLKLAHSFKVYSTACAIIDEERPANARACKLAALYHDVGRFEQYLKFHTFRDVASCNHGLLGVKILKQKGRLSSETQHDRHLVLTAIGMHNRKIVPEHLPQDFLTACHITRDADKLDILRIMAEHLSGSGPYNPTVILSLPNDPGPGNEAVTACVEKRQAANYADLKTVNDFRVLLGTWLYDLHFKTSRLLCVKNGHARDLVEGLADIPFYAKAKATLLQDLK